MFFFPKCYPFYKLCSTLISLDQWTEVSRLFGQRATYAATHSLTAGQILSNVIVSGCVTFYQIHEFFLNMIFSHYWQNVFAAGWNGFVGRIWAAGRSLETPSLDPAWSDYFWPTGLFTKTWQLSGYFQQNDNIFTRFKIEKENKWAKWVCHWNYYLISINNVLQMSVSAMPVDEVSLTLSYL